MSGRVMSAFNKQQTSKHCLYHLYIEGVGDIQYSLQIPCPYTETFREIIQRALDDILNLQAHSKKARLQTQSFHNVANSFPRQYLNSNNTGFYPNLYLKIGQKMIDPKTEDIELMVDTLLQRDHTSINLNASFISYQPKFNEALFIIVMKTARYPLSYISTTTTNHTPDNTDINQHDDKENTNTNTTTTTKSKTIHLMSSTVCLPIIQWEVILTFLSIKDLISCIESTKAFSFIAYSELLANHWVNILSFSYLASRALSVFYRTDIFQIFSRTISYKMNNLQKKCFSINIYSPKNKRYQLLFKYSKSCVILSHKAKLFRKCVVDDGTSFSYKIKNGEQSIVDKNKVIERLNKYFHFHKWRFYMNWEKYNIAGGSLLKCVSANSFHSSQKQDIDLFYAFKNEQYAETIKNNKLWAHLFMDNMVDNGYAVIYHVTNHVIDVAVNFGCKSPNVRKVSFSEYMKENGYSKYMKENGYSKTEYESILNEKTWVKFQFISLFDFPISVFISMSDEYGSYDEITTMDHDNIISNFDLDICQIRFDGNDIFCTFAFIFAISSMTCISYKLPLKTYFVIRYTVDWCAFFRAIKYNNRGFTLLVPYEFDLDPLDSVLYSNWYKKLSSRISHPNVGYNGLRNHDFVGVLFKVKSIARNDRIQKLIKNTPGKLVVDNQVELDLSEVLEKVLQYGIFSDDYVSIISNIDPAYILQMTDHFSWLYSMLSKGHIVSRFEWVQSYIPKINKFPKLKNGNYWCNKSIKNREWDLLVLASILFARCFWCPATLKVMLQKATLFKRFMMIFHWILDYWFHIQRFKPTEQFDPLAMISKHMFLKLRGIQAAYSTFLNANHLRIYVKNKKLFKRYILDVLYFETKYDKNPSKNKYSMTSKNLSRLRVLTTTQGTMTPLWKILAIKLLKLYYQDGKSDEIPLLNKFLKFAHFFMVKPARSPKRERNDEQYENDAKYRKAWLKESNDLFKAWLKECNPHRISDRKYNVNLNKRIHKALNDMYNDTYCQYKSCNINYYKHLYGLEYSLLCTIDNWNGENAFNVSYIIDGRKWFKCKGCKLIYYCSRKCQKKDWVNHKNVFNCTTKRNNS
eukprot:174386_1